MLLTLLTLAVSLQLLNCLEVTTLVSISTTPPLQFPQMDVMEIQAKLINSSRNGTENVCWPNRRFMSYHDQGEKFILSTRPSLQHNQKQSTKPIDQDQSIINFGVSGQFEIYVITSLGRVLYVKEEGKSTSRVQQIKISQQQSKQLKVSHLKLLSFEKGVVVVTNKSMYLLSNTQFNKMQKYQISDISALKYLNSNSNNNNIQLLAISNNTIHHLVMNQQNKQIVSTIKLPAVEQLKSKYPLKQIVDLSINPKDSTNIFVLDKQQGVFQLKSSQSQNNHLLNITNCHKLQYLQNHLIVSCKQFKTNTDFVIELYYNNQSNKYQSRTQQNQQKSKIKTLNLISNYYILSRQQGIQFYQTANRYNINNTQHISINQIATDPLVATQFIQHNQQQYFYYSTNQTIIKAQLKESLASIYCYSYISIQQSYNLTYKGLCDGNVCTKQSILNFKSFEYKFFCVMIDLVGIIAAIGFYFYKRSKKTIIESAEHSFEMIQLSQNSDGEDKQS